MRQIKEVLRLHHEGHLSERQIAHGCGISRSTVQRYLERATAANLGWPLPESLDDGQLEQMLFPPQPANAANEEHLPSKPQPDFAGIHQELKANKSVTLQLLWEEFMEQHPDGAHYSWFCEQYRAWARHLDVVLRQDHRAGEKTFVDHAGDTIEVIDPARAIRLTSSSQCSAPATIPLPKPLGHAACRIGSVRIPAHWRFSAGPRG